MCRLFSYIPETNHVSRVCNVAAILLLRIMVYVMLFPMLNVTLVLSGVCVSQPLWLLSVMPRFSGMLLRYPVHSFDIFLVAPVISAITAVFRLVRKNAKSDF